MPTPAARKPIAPAACGCSGAAGLPGHAPSAEQAGWRCPQGRQGRAAQPHGGNAGQDLFQSLDFGCRRGWGWSRLQGSALVPASCPPPSGITLPTSLGTRGPILDGAKAGTAELSSELGLGLTCRGSLLQPGRHLSSHRAQGMAVGAVGSAFAGTLCPWGAPLCWDPAPPPQQDGGVRSTRRQSLAAACARRGCDRGVCACTVRRRPRGEGVRADPALGKRLRPRLQRAEDTPGCVPGGGRAGEGPKAETCPKAALCQ